MIFCKKAELSRYLNLDKNLDTAIRFILAAALPALNMGRNDIDGEDAYVNRFDYVTAPERALLFESHRQYVDVHLLLSGDERILCAVEGALTPVEADEAADYAGFQGTEAAAFHMTPKDALIVFPGEAHKVKCAVNSPAPVQKAVVKVRFSDNA